MSEIGPRAQAGLQHHADAVEDLWRYYEEHAEQARQHETLRASVTSTLSAVAAAVVGLAGVGGIERVDVLTGATVVVVGLLGAALSVKHYERNRFHTKVMEVTRNEIEAARARGTNPEAPGALRSRAVQAHGAEFSLFSSDRRAAIAAKSPWVRTRLHILWIALPLLVAVCGAVIIVLALLGA